MSNDGLPLNQDYGSGWISKSDSTSEKPEFGSDPRKNWIRINVYLNLCVKLNIVDILMLYHNFDKNNPNG